MNARLTNRSRSTLLTPDWVTVRGSSTISTIVQAPESWTESSGHVDATFFIEVAEVTAPVGAATGLVLIQIESAPAADESLFVPVAGPFVATPTTTPVVLKSASAGATPISRFIRWKVISTFAASFDVTFRLRMTCNRQTYFAPCSLPGCIFWVRADRGLTVNNNTLTKWADQTSANDATRNLTAGHAAGSANNPQINAIDTHYAGQPTIAFASASSTYLTTPSFKTAVVQPDTWVIVGHTPTSAAYQIIIDANDQVSGQFVGRTNTGLTIIQTNGVGLTTSYAWSAQSMVLAEFNGASSKIYINNLTTPAVTGSVGTGTGSSQNSLTVGSQDAAWGPTNYWDGPIAEIIGFSGILSSTAKAKLRTYLNNRYALGIT